MVSWLKEESADDVLWIKADTKGYKVASSASQHSLILIDVGREYSGTYTCIATNRAGQSLCTAHLEVEEGMDFGMTIQFVVSCVLMFDIVYMQNM